MSRRTAAKRLPRLGLALSGGGFRASLFHVGVLARLAELDLLREVQVLSTVSGGSIIGALYYLHVRNLLQRKPDDQITRTDYIELIDTLAREFTVAVGSNLRMLAFADAGKNQRMLRDVDYSRSDRMAELYEQYLYAPVVNQSTSDPVRLPRLTISPRGMPTFHPFKRVQKDWKINDDRVHKVPVLVVNATTLNTGHNFQFTATWLGEPPGLGHHGDLDRNLRLRRAYYGADRLPKKYQELPLAVAVAASAAVPGIFPPLALTDLYRDGADPITPQLVDGGVHDNQGIEGLLDPDHACTHLIVSDASGQMQDVANPVTGIGNVFARSNDALMDRVREEQHAVLALLKKQRAIQGLVYFHLKDGLRQRELTWIGGEKPAAIEPMVSYRVHPRVQELLADVRTDLDAFTEVEAHALMADGYLIASHHLDDAFRTSLQSSPAAEDRMGEQRKKAPAAEPWAFLDAQVYLENPDFDPSFIAQLAAASRRIGKTRRIVPASARAPLPVLHCAALAVIALGGGALWWYAGRGLLAALLLLAATRGIRAAARAYGWPRLEQAMRRLHAIVPGALTSPFLAWAVGRHLNGLTPLRLKYGSIDRLRQPEPAVSGVEREAA